MIRHAVTLELPLAVAMLLAIATFFLLRAPRI